jgi:hypothetical protein
VGKAIGELGIAWWRSLGFSAAREAKIAPGMTGFGLLSHPSGEVELGGLSSSLFSVEVVLALALAPSEADLLHLIISGGNSPVSPLPPCLCVCESELIRSSRDRT